MKQRLFVILVIFGACSAGVDRTLLFDEVERLQDILLERDVVRSDFAKIEQLVRSHSELRDTLDEAFWLLEQGEAEHAAHSLSTFERYVRRAEIDECISHELSHIRIFLKHHDLDRVAHAQDRLDVQQWIATSRVLQTKFPHYYKNHVETKERLLDVHDRLSVGDFGPDTFEGIEFLETRLVC